MITKSLRRTETPDILRMVGRSWEALLFGPNHRHAARGSRADRLSSSVEAPEQPGSRSIKACQSGNRSRADREMAVPGFGRGRRARLALGVCAGALAVAVGGCAAVPEVPGAASSPPKKLTVVAHDSFAISDEAKARFAAQSGLDVTYLAPGNAGTVVNQLVLTKDSPLGDVVFGIDNTFAGRAIEAGVLDPYVPPALPAGADKLAADGSGSLTPIDYGDVCVNADTDALKAKGVPVPATLDDLVKPEYKDLLVVPNPTMSSPGLAFLIATVGAKGDPGYLDYWTALKANGVKIVDGWTQAYTVEFSGSSGKGPRPLVLSYASSPADEVRPDGTVHNVVATGTCFRQVEYAGVVKGAANPDGARAFIDFMLSAPVQAEIPDQMYMRPVDPSVALPQKWEEFTPDVTDPITVPAVEIAKNREAWLQAWTQAVIG